MGGMIAEIIQRGCASTAATSRFRPKRETNGRERAGKWTNIGEFPGVREIGQYHDGLSLDRVFRTTKRRYRGLGLWGKKDEAEVFGFGGERSDVSFCSVP